MIRVGITSLGFMGRMHFRCYKALEGVKVAAVCDVDQAKLKASTESSGNIAGAEEPLDLSDVQLYADLDTMLAQADLDAVSITMPTYMHAEYTAKALAAGVNVLCEKPMALNTKDCRTMIDAAKQSGKVLQIGHCIRFWPEYAKTKEIIDSSQYGKVLTANFRRLSAAPMWSWNNWLMNAELSGSATLDLHIHDTDYVQYLFGMPPALQSRGTIGPSGGYDYIQTQYLYDDNKTVSAEGAWLAKDSFGFEMSFIIMLEEATIVYDCTRDPAFKVCPAQGEPFTPELTPGDGYSLEIEHFIKTIKGETVPEITTPESSMDSVMLIEAEKQSAKSAKEVKIK